MFKSRTWVPISKDETQIYKGIGILLIVLHNYFHWVRPITGENEFGISKDYIINFWNFFLEDPFEIINLFFSYFGHYGVEIFVFISAYGLSKSYSSKKINWFVFIKKRLFKLYPTLIIAFVFFIILTLYKTNEFPTKDVFKQLFYKLIFINNFLPDQALSIIGPWWFYSLIVQLYILFPLLRYINKKTKSIGLIILIAISFYIRINYDYSFWYHTHSNLLFTFVGHLPVFCLGIIIATREKFKLNPIIFFLTLIVFALGNWYKFFWFFSHLTVMILMIYILKTITPIVKNYSRLFKFLSYYGLISMFLFACNGFLRTPFTRLANLNDNAFTTILFSLSFLIFATGISEAIRGIENNGANFIRNVFLKKSP